MKVSKGGQYLLVVDRLNCAAVFPGGRSMMNARPIVSHELRAEYPSIGIFSGMQPD